MHTLYGLGFKVVDAHNFRFYANICTLFDKANQEKRETEHREKGNDGKQDVCNYNTGDMIVEKNA